MNRRIFQLFRAWIPSWRFFETLSDQPVLFYRFATIGNEVSGEWHLALKRPPRALYSVLLNAEGNLHLANYTLLDQLEEDMGELQRDQIDVLPQLPSYQLVQNLVCFLLRERKESASAYQFKVSRMLANDKAEFEEILVSTVHNI